MLHAAGVLRVVLAHDDVLIQLQLEREAAGARSVRSVFGAAHPIAQQEVQLLPNGRGGGRLRRVLRESLGRAAEQNDRRKPHRIAHRYFLSTVGLTRAATSCGVSTSRTAVI